MPQTETPRASHSAPAEVLDFIRTTIAETGVPPSSPEIRERFQWKWTASAQQTAWALEHMGYVTSEVGVARSLRLVEYWLANETF